MRGMSCSSQVCGQSSGAWGLGRSPGDSSCHCFLFGSLWTHSWKSLQAIQAQSALCLCCDTLCRAIHAMHPLKHRVSTEQIYPWKCKKLRLGGCCGFEKMFVLHSVLCLQGYHTKLWSCTWCSTLYNIYQAIESSKGYTEQMFQARQVPKMGLSLLSSNADLMLQFASLSLWHSCIWKGALGRSSLLVLTETKTFRCLSELWPEIPGQSLPSDPDHPWNWEWNSWYLWLFELPGYLPSSPTQIPLRNK